jgi:hypothetical protein
MRFVCALSLCLTALAGRSDAEPADKAATSLLGRAPIRFESVGARGWTAYGPSFEYRIDGRGILVRAGQRFGRIEFQGAAFQGAAGARFESSDPAPSVTQYFQGTSRIARKDFFRLRQPAVYPGIDVVYYGQGSDLEYDFEIQPGADPSRIALSFPGADRVELKDDGELVITLSGRKLGQRPPVVYQRTATGTIAGVESRYWIADDGSIRLKLGAFDASRQLVVDPVIAYTAYFGGAAGDSAVAVAHDAAGFVYVAGNTLSTNFAATSNAYQAANDGNQDCFVIKLNPFATDPTQVLVYASYFGGGANETLHAMTVDSKGLIYLAGTTNSATFPLSASAFQSSVSVNNHAFVSVIDPTAAATSALLYSTFLGGTNFEEAFGIAVANGLIYVTGYTTSDDFPIGNAYNTKRTAGYDAFITLLDPTKSSLASLVGSTFFGGTGQDIGRAIAVDSTGIAYVTGYTSSSNLPTTSNAFQSFYQGNGDAFLVQMNMVTAQLLYCSYFGSSDIDDAKSIVVEPAGRVALAGFTLGQFPTQLTPVQIGFGGNGDAFLAIFDLAQPSQQQLAYLAYYGGSDGEVAYSLARDTAGKYYLGGYTLSRDLPVTSDALNPGSDLGGYDGFIAVIDPKAAASKAL